MSDLLQRMVEGDPEAWSSPEAPLLLLGGALSTEQAQAGALACLEAAGRRSPLLDTLVQAWWQQADARELCRLLGQLGALASPGSHEHRRAVLVACLCARTVLPYAGPWREEVEGCLAELERWAWGDASVELDEVHVHVNAVWDASGAATEIATCHAVSAALHAANAAAVDDGDVAEVYRAACVAVDSVARASAVIEWADQYEAPEASAPRRKDRGAAESRVRAAYLRSLTDLIRSAVPNCPLLEASHG